MDHVLPAKLEAGIPVGTARWSSLTKSCLDNDSLMYILF